MNQSKSVGTFVIPEDLAKELSELLIKQNIREHLMLQLIDQPDKYEEMEKTLIPITARIEAIKMIITNDYVPEVFRDQRFMWNYDGWEIAKTTVKIYEQ